MEHLWNIPGASIYLGQLGFIASQALSTPKCLIDGKVGLFNLEGDRH
jgi:hypothetical protein